MKKISILNSSSNDVTPSLDGLPQGIQTKRQSYKHILGLSIALAACGPTPPAQETGTSSSAESSSSSTGFLPTTTENTTVSEVTTSTTSTTEIPTTSLTTDVSTASTTQETTSTTTETTDGTGTSTGTGSETTGSNPDCGELIVIYQGNPDADILTTGEKRQISRQVFASTGQSYLVNTLTVSNDLEGSFGDQPTNAQPEIGTISIEFKDQNNQSQVAIEGVNNTGETTFENLNLLVPEGVESELKVSVNLLGNAVESGKKIRIALKTSGNTNDTFSAVGLEDNTIDNLTQDCAVSNFNDVKAFTLRNAKPVFSDVMRPNILVEGENILKGVEVEAKTEFLEEIGLNRLAYKVVLMDADQDGKLNFNAFKMVRDGNVIQDARIFGVNSGNIGMGGGSISKAGDTVIVSFDQQQEVSDPSAFSLRATAAGVETDDTISTKLVDDDQVELTGLDANGSTSNTGQVFVQGDLTKGIFTAADDDFSRKLFPGRALLWADGSAGPLVNNGKVVSGTGADNHTNGNLLNLASLKTDTLQN